MKKPKTPLERLNHYRHALLVAHHTVGNHKLKEALWDLYEVLMEASDIQEAKEATE